MPPGIGGGAGRLNVDVIFTATDLAAVAARNATATIPIIFMSVSDPVALGLVVALARPSGNATGVTNVHRELTRKRLGLLKELVPGERIVAVLTPATPTPTTTAMLNELKDAAGFLRVQLYVRHVESAPTLDSAITAIVAAACGSSMSSLIQFSISTEFMSASYARKRASP